MKLLDKWVHYVDSFSELAPDGISAYNKMYNHIFQLDRRYHSGFVLTTKVESSPFAATPFCYKRS